MIKIIPLMGALLLCGCGHSNSAQSDTKDISIANDVITVSKTAPVIQKIKTEKVVSSGYQAQFSTSGMVKAIPTSYAEIATPFAGRIVRSFVRLGQSVNIGSPLFEISSPAFFETGKAYFAAKQEQEQALKSLTRERDLLANRVGVGKDVEEAQVNYELKKQDYENAKSALKVFQVDPASMRLGEPLIVRSPIAGKVVANNIIIGQYIKEDAAPLAAVADLNKVWVMAHVKEKDIRLIERLQEVEIRLSASPEESLKGKIYHISEMLDEATRSVEVIIECNNREGKMKPFMYGTVMLTDAKTEAILIPTAAILQQEESNYVLVEVAPLTFKKVEIEVASTTDDRSVVTSGLKAGDEIVVKGAFYLLDAK
ncbi:MAG: efflux RND transporter periplasmic adaptor subunit [Alistipes sp.]